MVKRITVIAIIVVVLVFGGLWYLSNHQKKTEPTGSGQVVSTSSISSSTPSEIIAQLSSAIGTSYGNSATTTSTKSGYLNWIVNGYFIKVDNSAGFSVNLPLSDEATSDPSFFESNLWSSNAFAVKYPVIYGVSQDVYTYLINHGVFLDATNSIPFPSNSTYRQTKDGYIEGSSDFYQVGFSNSALVCTLVITPPDTENISGVGITSFGVPLNPVSVNCVTRNQLNSAANQQLPFQEAVGEKWFTVITIGKQNGNFVLLNVCDFTGTCGAEAIGEILPGSKFVNIWGGNGSLDCSTVDKYNVPALIYGNCVLPSGSCRFGGSC